MKRLSMKTLAILMLAAPSIAMADGPAPGTYDPIVTAPPAPAYSFAGFYGGLSFTQTEATVKDRVQITETTPTSEEVPIEAECIYTSSHSGGGKCAFPDGITELEFPGLERCNGKYGDTCLIRRNKDGSDYTFVLGGAKGEAYQYDTGETRTVAGPDLVETFSESITDLIETGTAGVFVGYAHELGNGLIGRAQIGSDGTITSMEAQAGLQIGRALPYAFAGPAHFDQNGGFDFDGTNGIIYGAGIDYLLTTQLIGGARCAAGDFESDTTVGCGVQLALRF